MKTLLQSCGLLVLASFAVAQETAQEVAQETKGTGLVLRTENATPGYTLFAPLQSRSTFLTDLDGEVVHEWKSELPPGNSVFLMANGNLLRCSRVEDNAPFRGGGIGGRLQEIAPDGTIVWDFSMAKATHHHHHDIEPLPNGNLLAIVWEPLSKERAIALGRDPKHMGETGLWVDSVFEIEPVRPDGGKIVWRWSSGDHLIQDFAEEGESFGEITAHPERIDINADHRERPPESAAQKKQREDMEARMRALGYVGGGDDDDKDAPAEGTGGGGGSDWLHSNSIEYQAEYDLIALSVRTMGEVWIIDHSTTTKEAASSKGGRYGHGGDLLYRWGNPRNYGAGENRDRQLFGQHDATFVAGPEGALHMLAFNNGAGRPGDESYSTVVEIALPFDAKTGFRREAGAFGPEEPCWIYAAPNKTDFFSSFISGAQRLWSGNTLIAAGAGGRFFEVTPSGEIAWELVNPLGGDVPLSRGGPPHGGPDDKDGPPPGGPGAGDGPAPGGPEGRGDRGRGGPPRMAAGAVFRITRLAPDHPGLRVLLAD